LRIDIVTVLPKLLESPLNESILKRAQNKGKVEIHIHNLREYGHGKHQQVDDKPYGGDAGMVLMIEPVSKCLNKLMAEREYQEIIYTTPDGKTLNQSIANQLSLKGNLLILCGHYKGIDQRIRDKYITLELSIGDYVLTGGELAACVIVDSIVRLIPGVISNEESALSDSFQDGLLSPPIYTRPAEFDGMKVPDVLLSGHFGEIAKWQEEQAYARTKNRRPDLLDENEDSLDSD
jgi:tRNA (guanine37-N1)-methyltransferase